MLSLYLLTLVAFDGEPLTWMTIIRNKSLSDINKATGAASRKINMDFATDKTVNQGAPHWNGVETVELCDP